MIMENLKQALKGQYHAALDMLRGAIEACPDSLWTGGVPPRSFWRLAYHTLFFTHLYLEVTEAEFVPWELHRDEVEGMPDIQRIDATPYSKAEIMAYWEFVDARNVSSDCIFIIAAAVGPIWNCLSTAVRRTA